MLSFPMGPLGIKFNTILPIGIFLYTLFYSRVGCIIFCFTYYSVQTCNKEYKPSVMGDHKRQLVHLASKLILKCAVCSL